MDDAADSMLAFLGVPPDRRLLDEDLPQLPGAEQRREPPTSTNTHHRLVAAGSLMTGVTLIGGGAAAIYGGWRLLFGGGGTLDAVIVVVGLLLAGTHWGWVHVAEYVGVTLDERRSKAADQRQQRWLASIEPYPRFSVSTSVLDDASTRVQRILHKPILTPHHTFTFVRRVEAEESYDADASAADIAAGVEALRRQARLDSDRLRELWESASSTYAAALDNAHDDRRRLAAQQAAATALSEHINASLLEPPLAE